MQAVDLGIRLSLMSLTKAQECNSIHDLLEILVNKLNQMKLLHSMTAAIVVASLMTFISSEAYGEDKVSEQRKLIQGTWNCIFKSGGKAIPTDKFQYSFSPNGLLKSDLQVGNSRVVTKGVWMIAKAEQLVFPGQKSITTVNLKTGTTKSRRTGKTTSFDIKTLSSKRLLFFGKGGKIASCKR